MPNVNPFVQRSGKTLIFVVVITSFLFSVWLFGVEYLSSPLSSYITIPVKELSGLMRNEISEKNRTRSMDNATYNINWNATIVTAFFDIGTFRKGYSQTFTPKLYHNWANSFKLILSPVVIYTDSSDFADHMRKVRQNFSENTIVNIINRTSLWAFQLEGRIKKVFSIKGYPKHYPNTVIAKYSCAQHAKYAVVADAAKKKYFRTKYYAWLDIGYFRDLVNSKNRFIMDVPKNLDKEKLGMNLVYSNIDMKMDYKRIIYSNTVWVGGGMFIGTSKCILTFEKSYRRAIDFLLKKDLMSTDQQVLLSMYSDKGKKDIKPTVELQLFKPDGSVNPWFYLGYLCRKVITNETLNL